MPLLRRSLLLPVLPLLASLLLVGCGFHLRANRPLPFASIAVTPANAAGVAGEITRYLDTVLPARKPSAGSQPPEVILDILREDREKLVAGVNATGQVREYDLRMRISFQLRSSRGDMLIEPTDIAQHRSISFNETAVLSKEAEEGLLYRDMQADIVQQLLRRLAAVKPQTASTTP
ncbi:MAG: LPS assembly lipoprotein LptE [Rhodoferax sp.]|nr:LPS assembly lipoprotein LptE [Rhodoferax sp.]